MQQQTLLKQSSALLLASLMLLFTSCTINTALESPEPSGFLHSSKVGTKPLALPFFKAWARPDFKPDNYSSIMVTDIDLSFVDKEEWQKSTGSFLANKQEFNRELRDLASYAKKTLKNHINNETSNKHGKTVVDKADQNTMVLKMAFTEVVFNRPELYAVALATPLPGVAQSLDITLSPVLAMELKILDQNNNLLATITDRRVPQFKPVDVNKLTVHSSLREIVDIWSDELTRSFDRDLDETVSRTSSVSLIPW